MNGSAEASVKTSKISAVIPAAGQGLRFGESTPKQFKVLAGRPLLFHTLGPFLALPGITEIIIAVPNDWIANLPGQIEQIDPRGKIRLVEGGKRRQDSVFNAVKATDTDTDIIIIHDAGRPFVTEQMIIDCLRACENQPGAIAAVPAHDTVKEVSSGQNLITRTIPREIIWLAQTPQAFKKNVLIEALQAAERDNIAGTDEAALVERLGYRIAVVNGSPGNLKITTPEDWQYARAIMEDKNG